MPFLSDLIGRPVADVDGQVMGSVLEVLANIKTDIAHPRLIALVVKRRKKQLTVSMDDVAVLIAPAISLKRKAQHLIPYEPCPDDLYLVRDVLDKQIIDTNGIRVVRVNDLELVRVGESIYVANVDISGAGLARRMGLKFLNQRLPSRSGRGSLPGIISWEDVELFASDQPMRLKVPSEKLTELHPADLAEILSDLTRQEGATSWKRWTSRRWQIPWRRWSRISRRACWKVCPTSGWQTCWRRCSQTKPPTCWLSCPKSAARSCWS